MANGEEIVACEGCGNFHLAWDLSEENYCPSCQYQYEANMDQLTGGNNE